METLAIWTPRLKTPVMCDLEHIEGICRPQVLAERIWDEFLFLVFVLSGYKQCVVPQAPKAGHWSLGGLLGTPHAIWWELYLDKSQSTPSKRIAAPNEDFLKLCGVCAGVL